MRCNTQLLWTLVNQQNEPSRTNSRLYAHVEKCSACQKELENLSGGGRWIEDATYWLSQDKTRIESQEKSVWDNIDCSDIKFLESPTHPELLGRLGRYDIESVLGRGGMGIVLRGFDIELQRPVAIKVLAPEWCASLVAKQRFAREAQAAASVAHENVVPIFNVAADAQPPYLVMQYIPGMTLQQWVDQKGPLPADSIIRITSQLVAGLSAAHSRGLVHRDVKPANVLVGENTERVWLTDFGLARAVDENRMTKTGAIAGTPGYMSPEQAKGQQLDARSDWFSLGSLIYFMCAAVSPFESVSTLATLQQIITARPRSLRGLRPDLPDSLLLLVNRLLSKKPERRPGCFEEIDMLLRASERELTGQRRRTWLRRARLTAASLLIAGGSSAVCWVAASFLIKGDQQQPTDQLQLVGQQNIADLDRITNPWESDEAVNNILFPEIVQQIENIAGWNTDSFDSRVRKIEREIRALGY